MGTKRVKLYGNSKVYPWQKQVHDYISDYLNRDVKTAETIVIKAARQRYGKSTLTKAELIRFSLTRKRSINGYISPTLNLARKMFKEIKASASKLIKNANQTDMIIEFRNGSFIQFFSEQQGEALRGFTVTGLLVIDEAAVIRDNTYFEFVNPWVTVHKALTVIISTPKFKMGFFYQLFLDGRDVCKEFVKTFDWVYDYDVPITKEDLDKKPMIPNLKWRSEYEGIFVNAEGTVFGNFEDLILDGVPEFEELYIGLDFGSGSGNDYTVLTALNEKAEQVFIWRNNELRPLEQVDAIIEILKKFTVTEQVTDKRGRVSTITKNKIKVFLAEKNSIGAIYIDAFIRKGINYITPFITSGTSKRKLVERLQVAIQNKAIWLLPDNQQTSELSFYESKVNPDTKNVSYNAPSGMNDDMVIALMLALESLKRGTNNINERIKII